MKRNKGRFYEAGHFKWDTITHTHLSGPLLLNNINSLTVGLNSKCRAKTKLLHMIQNAAARLVFSEPKRAHVTPFFISLWWHHEATLARRSQSSWGDVDFHKWVEVGGGWASGCSICKHQCLELDASCNREPVQEDKEEWTFHPHLECWIPDNF